MPIFHSHASICSRSQGHSAVAKAAYNAACKLVEKVVDRTTGLVTEIVHDYTRKQGVAFSKILMPQEAEGMFESREELWNLVSHFEVRKNAQLSRNFTFALPCELSPEENDLLAENYINDCFVTEGMIADYNIHYDNHNNPHLHIMLTKRRVIENENGVKTFGEKVREWDKRDKLVHWRAMWAAYVNKEMEVRGFTDRISHLSHSERGIDLEATIHEGVSTQRIDNSERVDLNREIKQNNFDRIKENPELVIDKLSINKAAFTKADIAKEVSKYFGVNLGKNAGDVESLNQASATEFLSAYERVMSSSRLAILTNQSLDGEVLYTSRARIELERRLVDKTVTLNNKSTHALGITKEQIGQLFGDSLKEHIKGIVKAIETSFGIKLGLKETLELSEKQKEVVLGVLNGSDISVIEGLPGAGKSTVVSEIARQLKYKGYRVFGAAVSSSASRNLAEAGEIFTQNLTKWRSQWEAVANNKLGKKFDPALALDYQASEVYKQKGTHLTERDVFIIDEMSMVSFVDLEYFLSEAEKAGAKVILLGDNNQLGAIKLSGSTKRITEITGSLILDEVRRQTNPLHRKATVLMSYFKLKEALEIYKETGVFKTAASREALREQLAGDYAKNYLKMVQDQDQKHLASHEKIAIIAYTNDEVRELNLLARQKLKQAGIIKNQDLVVGKVESKQIKVAEGEQIVFTRNERKLGVINGDVGIIKAIDGRMLSVDVIREGKAYSVKVNTEKYNSIDYGYAITIHKAQGRTYNNVYALYEDLTGFEIFNVMMTRHTENLKCYIDKELIQENLHTNIKYKEEDKLSEAILNGIKRRSKSDFSIDYMNSENLPEVRTLKAYIEAKEDAYELFKTIEREKLEAIKKTGVEISTWESGYAEDFKEVLEIRNDLALEICNNFDSYKKLISQTRLSYDVIASHAGIDGIVKEYVNEKSNIDTLNYNQNQYVSNKNVILVAESLKELSIKEHGPLFESDNSIAKEKLLQASKKLITEHKENALKVESLSLDLAQIREDKHLHESKLNDQTYYKDDVLPFILSQVFTDGKAALEKWEPLIKKEGAGKAVKVVKDDYKVLGKLRGIGIGSVVAIDKAREEANAHISTLHAKLAKYEEAKAGINELQASLKENKWETEMEKIQRGIDQVKAKLLDKETLEIAENIIENGADTESLINYLKEKKVQEWVDRSLKSADKVKGREEERVRQAQKTSNKDALKANHVEREYISFDEVARKLIPHAKELGSHLLPMITGDKVQVVRDGLKCGSIIMNLSGSKQGLWYRFSRGQGGNLFDLIKEANGFSDNLSSLKWAADWLNIDHYKEKTSINSNELALNNKDSNNKNQEITKAWTTQKLVPSNAPEPNIEKQFAKLLETHTHEATYEYKNLEGNLIGYVVRFKDMESGAKQTLPLVWAKNEKNSREGWRSQGFDGKPIYGLEKLSQDKKTVLIVEGEKTADAAQQMLPEYTVISWLGGIQSADKVYWSILKDRKVVIWPDADAPGMKAANVISDKLEGLGCDASIVNPYKLKFAGQVHENLLPNKWDLADSLPETITIENIREAISNAINNRLELTSEKIEEATNKLDISDNYLYRQTLKQAKELAGISRLYPDASSLVNEVFEINKLAINQIKDIGYLAKQESLELNDYVKEGAIASKFHESLLSNIYAKEVDVDKNAHDIALNDKVHSAIKGYEKLQNSVQVLSDEKYKGVIQAACKEMSNLDIVPIIIDIYKQAAADIIAYDMVTTQALLTDFNYFVEVNKELVSIFIDQKDSFKQASDITNEMTIKSIYNKIYDRIVCNDKIADNLVAENDRFAERQTKEVEIYIKIFEKEIEAIEEINPHYDIAKLKNELKVRDKEAKKEFIKAEWFKTINENIKGRLEELKDQRTNIKTINDALKVMEQEKEFCLMIDKKYPGFSHELSEKTKESFMSKNAFAHKQNPHLIDNLKEDILQLQQHTIIPEKIILQDLRNASSHQAISQRMFTEVQDHHINIIERNIQKIEAGQTIEKFGQKFTTVESYLHHELEHKENAKYLKATKIEKQLTDHINVQKQREIEQQHEQERQKEASQQIHRFKGLGLDK